MLRSLKDLEHYQVGATDGDIGKVENFLLDDERWIIRYLVVDRGGLLEDRQVLISPISFGEPDWATQRFHLKLTMAKIRNSPGIDMDEPVSRQKEREFHRYYGYNCYWGSSGIWGMAAYPGSLAEVQDQETPGAALDQGTDDHHLRSAREVRGYHVQGSDDAIGHIDDFIVDDETWAVRYLVVDTSNWWFGKKVLVAPLWATEISWEERKVHLDLSRQAIKDSPQWDAGIAINREYETHLYDYYGRPAYWVPGAPVRDTKRKHHPKAS
jgi:hypothetical protein